MYCIYIYCTRPSRGPDSVYSGVLRGGGALCKTTRRPTDEEEEEEEEEVTCGTLTLLSHVRSLKKKHLSPITMAIVPAGFESLG